MITFNAKKAYVWIWLPNAVEPVVAGRLEVNGEHHDFVYGQSYCNNPNAIALSKNELPLLKGHRYTSTYSIHHVIRDALPDAWGQRVLSYRYVNHLSALDQLLLSSSDRVGALHFQKSPTLYAPHDENNTSLEALLEAADIVERGDELPENLAMALMHGTSVGGARPKALISKNQKKYIAKFSTTTDLYPMIQAECAAMWLARKLGINAANVELIKVKGRYILLVERFDRELLRNQWSRKFMTSALSLLDLDEMEGRYASYLDLAEIMRKDCVNPIASLEELYRRMVFNILVGNTDDHAKNHAFFWNGENYSLTPGYDICPYLRSGIQATQAMTVGTLGNYSTLNNALSGAAWFQLEQETAKTIIQEQVDAINAHWQEACDYASLTKKQSHQLWQSAILNPYCFYTSP